MHFSILLLSILPTALAAPVADALEKRSLQGLPIQAGSPQDTFGGVGQPNPFATDDQIQSHPAGFFSGQLDKRAKKPSPQGLPIRGGSPQDTFGGVGKPNPFATDEQIKSHPAGFFSGQLDKRAKKPSPQGLPIRGGSPQDTFGGVGKPNPFATDEQIKSHPAGFFSGQLDKRATKKPSPQGLPIQAGSPQDTFGGVGKPNPFATDKQIKSHPAGFFSGQLDKRATKKPSPQGLPIQAGSPQDTFGGVGKPNPFATDEQIQNHPAGFFSGQLDK